MGLCTSPKIRVTKTHSVSNQQKKNYSMTCFTEID